MDSHLDWLADELTQGQGLSVQAMTLRLLFATLLGAVLGWEREARDKPAGLRTHMLVSIGSATFTLLGFETGAELTDQGAHSGHAGVDPTRIIQGIVGGLGFLGAGSIIKSKGNEDVMGLTTAASVWFTGALGVACGMGAYLLALTAVGLGLIVLTTLGRWSKSGNAPRNRTSDASDDPPGTEAEKASHSVE